MFEHLDDRQRRKVQGASTLASIGLHSAVILAVFLFAAIKSTAPVEQEIQVKFIGPGNQPGPPPPPPPPAGPRHVKRKVTQPKQEIIRPVEVPKEIPKEVPKEPDVEVKEDGKEGGVEGGKEGGVIGGVVGGVVGGTGGGGTAAPPPPPPEKPKAKNVPPFVIARDMIRQPMPRLSEVFKQAHRGETLTGVYKVCVGQDGHVYEVNIIKSVPGADEEVVEGVKNDWLYKEQQVPVCFIYSMPISIVQ